MIQVLRLVHYFVVYTSAFESKRNVYDEKAPYNFTGVANDIICLAFNQQH